MAEHKIDMKGRILRQNALYGYNTIPDEEWFINGQKIVISTHGYMKNDKSMNPRPSLHNHAFFEMNYVYRGTLYNCVEGVEVTETENSLMMLSPKVRHICYTQQEEDIVFNFLIKRDLVEGIFLQILSESAEVCRFFLDALYNTHVKLPYLTFFCDEDIRELLHEIIEEYFQKEPFCESIITAKMIELFSVLSRKFDGRKDRAVQKQHDFAAEFNQYLESHYADMTLSSAAACFGYTDSSFSRLVRNKFSKTFSEILRETRIKYACRYLTYSNLPVKAISEIVGYTDLSYFYRIFQKQMKISPARFRSESQLLLKD